MNGDQMDMTSKETRWASRRATEWSMGMRTCNGTTCGASMPYWTGPGGTLTGFSSDDNK